MPTSQDYVEYLHGQLAPAGRIETLKMFGEYGLYLDGKFIGLVADNQLYLKETESTRAFLGNEVSEASPYEGAKKHFVFDTLDDQDFVCQALRLSFQELPWPKPKSPKKRKS